MLAVFVRSELSPITPIFAVVVGEHQALSLRRVRSARIHPSAAVRSVGIPVTATGLFRRRRKLWGFTDGAFSRFPLTFGHSSAFCSVFGGIAFIELSRDSPVFREHIAASFLFGGGRSGGGGDHAVIRVLGGHPLTPFALALALLHGLGAFSIGFDRISAATSWSNGRGRRRRRVDTDIPIKIANLSPSALIIAVADGDRCWVARWIRAR